MTWWETRLNAPNVLTVCRFFLAAGFMGLIGADSVGFRITGGLLFLVAAVSDWLDGYLARKYEAITSFGKILDPIADKFLTLGAFIVFTFMGLVDPWMCWIIAAREGLVTITRFWALARGKVLAADTMGKFKTVLQFAVIGMLIVFSVFLSMDHGSGASMRYGKLIIDGVMVVTVVVTLISGWDHYYRNREAYRG
jgi:CDP-diacylglycerol---glycerol-3-phosphate 3-phosphatidyltransferase